MDRYAQGDVSALNESELRGQELFFSERLECFHCHGGFNFSSSVDHANNVFEQTLFANNGLYNLDEDGAYPPSNPGLFETTNDPIDHGRFKPPSLRNIDLTAPYMHDGSIATLAEVIEHYAAGGRLIEGGPFAGDGRANPNKSSFVKGFSLTTQEKSDVIAFLRALTDEEFLNDPRFSDPFVDTP